MKKTIIALFALLIVSSLSAQTQSWQWVRAGGSRSDNIWASNNGAVCKIAGCDARGNVYAIGDVNGSNMRFDTFSSPGSHSSIGTNNLLFSYDCAGHMRWAKQIGDDAHASEAAGAVTDMWGNTYVVGNFYMGIGLHLYLGDTIISNNMQQQTSLFLLKYDSLGRLKMAKPLGDTMRGFFTAAFATAFGLRMGGTGHLWIGCNIDTSNFAISANFRTTKHGHYQMEVDPGNGMILSGYYASNYTGIIFDDLMYDIDGNDNYYEVGTLYGDLGLGNADTLKLTNQILAPDTHFTSSKPYIVSLDRHGNFRYIVTTSPTSYSLNGFNRCKYDRQSDRLITTWHVDSMVVYGSDTFRFNRSQLYGNPSNALGLFAIGPSGNILWGKYVTKATEYVRCFLHVPGAFYSDNLEARGLVIWDNTDTLFNKDINAPQYDYTRVICKIDKNGKLKATYNAHVGNVSNINSMMYGATDWRGNVYLGGTFTNYFATPTDSVVNTDFASGNFIIAKIGISDCSCPTPGVQFSTSISGDTVRFYGSSSNRRDSIHWRLSDGTIITRDTFLHVFAHGHTYTVTATAYNGCGIDSLVRQVNVHSGITETAPKEAKLYPNPAKGKIFVDIPSAARMGLVSVNGTSMWDKPVEVNQQGTYVFDISSLSSGLYYFIAEYSDGRIEVLPVDIIK